MRRHQIESDEPYVFDEKSWSEPEAQTEIETVQTETKGCNLWRQQQTSVFRYDNSQPSRRDDSPLTPEFREGFVADRREPYGELQDSAGPDGLRRSATMIVPLAEATGDRLLPLRG